MTKEVFYYLYVHLDIRESGKFIYGKHVFNHKPIYVGVGHYVQYGGILIKNKYARAKDSCCRDIEWCKNFKEVFNKKWVLILKDNETSPYVIGNLEQELISEIGRKDVGNGPLYNKNWGGSYGGSYKFPFVKEKVVCKIKDDFPKIYHEKTESDLKYEYWKKNRWKFKYGSYM